ncbi:MAG: low molecular weight phosphatase family protein [Microbacterium sp.]|uniref:arsenate reductase/protein-tyrosine-phosphatase family protein n=1 Tax=Microbacterium sp. TaxID=51671 RepID=UPI003F808812
MTFRILTVCTGNICRSPLAEQLLRAHLRPLDATVESAGVSALVGVGMPAPALALAGRLGVTDAADHVGRQVTVDLVRNADLVLAMSREHRRALVELTPAATRKTFTIRELANIAAGISDDELAGEVAGTPDATDALRAAVGLASALRGVVEPLPSPDDLDVIDPYRQSDAVYEQSASQLVPAAAAVGEFLMKAAER